MQEEMQNPARINMAKKLFDEYDKLGNPFHYDSAKKTSFDWKSPRMSFCTHVRKIVKITLSDKNKFFFENAYFVLELVYSIFKGLKKNLFNVLKTD